MTRSVLLRWSGMGVLSIGREVLRVELEGRLERLVSAEEKVGGVDLTS
jgi:hypothetical protein